MGQRSACPWTHTSLGLNLAYDIYMLCDLGMSLTSLSLMFLNLENVPAVAVDTNTPRAIVTQWLKAQPGLPPNSHSPIF